MARVSSLWHRGRKSTAARNLLALNVVLLAFGLLRLNFDPLPVGADPTETTIDVSRFAHAGVTATLVDSASARDKSATNAAAPAGDRETLELNAQALARAVSYLETIPDYTATFFKRELVNGAMSDGQVVHMKLRHNPLSVYMKWIVGDKGRELLYVEGENNGNMLVKVGGMKGRLLPCVKLDPQSPMAMKEARHPVTEVGLLNLARRLLHHRREELAASNLPLRCKRICNQQLDGVSCECFVLDFANPEVCSPYRRSVQYFEKEHSLPVCIMNYCWPSAGEGEMRSVDESDLIEHYSYSDLRLNQRLADVEFDRTNENYLLRR
jgi:hypothetical protein